MTKYCEYVKYFPTKIIKAHITHMDYYHTLKLFLYFKRKHYMSLEETWRGKWYCFFSGPFQVLPGERLDHADIL